MAKDKDKDKDAKPRQQAAQQQQPKAPRKEAKAKKDAAPAPVKETGPKIPAPPARLAIQYRDKIVPDLMKKFGYTTVMQEIGRAHV